jgi:hypothetical protein
MLFHSKLQNCSSVHCYISLMKPLNSCLNTYIYSYLDTFGFNTIVIRHLWQFKTVVFLHCCLIHTCCSITTMLSYSVRNKD